MKNNLDVICLQLKEEVYFDYVFSGSIINIEEHCVESLKLKNNIGVEAVIKITTSDLNSGIINYEVQTWIIPMSNIKSIKLK